MLEIDALQPIRAVTDRIAAVQERLRFSDPFVQFEVGFYASATPAYLALPLPDLCADARCAGRQRLHEAHARGERLLA